MRRFGTHGRLYPEDHYLVPRTVEVADFIRRVKEGKYIVLFAPRQTGKTTFFQLALAELAATDLTYFPIHLNFEVYEGCTPAEFYGGLAEDIPEKIVEILQERGETLPEAFMQFLENAQFTNHLSLRRFFRQLAGFLKNHLRVPVPTWLIISRPQGRLRWTYSLITSAILSPAQVFGSCKSQIPRRNLLGSIFSMRIWVSLSNWCMGISTLKGKRDAARWT